MKRKLFHSIDSNATLAEKYVEHGTPIVKLVPRHIRDAMRALRKELPSDDG